MRHFYFVIAVAFAVASGMQANADSAGPKMVLRSTNGKTTEIAVKSIGSISFTGNSMNFTSADNMPMEQIDVLTLENITFDLEGNSGEAINRVFDDGISITVNGCAISVTSGNSDPLKVAVYSIGGVCVMQGEGVGKVSLDLNSLASGVYVIRANNKTVKYIR